MHHSVRTTFGDPTSSYGGDKYSVPLKPPPQGPQKGNEPDPQIWVLVSTPLLNLLQDIVHGEAFKWCLPVETMKLDVYWFAYDSTIIPVAPAANSPTQEIVKVIQEGLDIFYVAAQTTRGKVSKKKWYLLEFVLDATGKWRRGNNDAHITLQTTNGLTNIKRIPPYQASRIMEVWIAPD